VLLCSHRPPEELDGATVALTGESRTSRGLLRVLLAGYWRVRPHLVEARSLATQGAQGMEPPAARLLIGDAALREVAQRGSAWPHLIDLGAAWREWTGLPFVYARWVVARDAPEGLAPALESALESALEISLGSLTPQNRYLNNLQYRLGAAEEAGLERFHEELKRHDLLGHHRREGRRRTAA
jgi:chorismate dehydratase